MQHIITVARTVAKILPVTCFALCVRLRFCLSDITDSPCGLLKTPMQHGLPMGPRISAGAFKGRWRRRHAHSNPERQGELLTDVPVLSCCLASAAGCDRLFLFWNRGVGLLQKT